MESKVKEALEIFMEYNLEMGEALKELRNAVKIQGSSTIQKYIEDENFHQANLVIEELNQFTNLNYVSNFDDIYSFAEKIISGTPDVSFNNKPKQTSNKYRKIAIINEVTTNTKMEKNEKEVIRELGFNSTSTYKDSKSEFLNELTIANLNSKGFVDIEEIEIGGNVIVTFELSEKGRNKFKELFQTEANESSKSQLIEKYGSLPAGLFIHEVENALEIRGFQINEAKIDQIEVLKEKRHTYLTPDLGSRTESDYFKILNRKNQLKNIGFVCIDSETMQRAQNATKKWAEKNESKCKLLNIHFTTIFNIEHTPSIFETIKY